MEAQRKNRNEHSSDEAWLRAAAETFRSDFEEIHKPLPAVIRFDFGFTSHGNKKTAISGQYYEGGASADGIPKVIIRCNTEDPVTILEALVHQLVHASVGALEGHGRIFREVALRIGKEPPMRTSKAGKRLRERLHALADDLGPFPNSMLNFETHGPDGKEKVIADKPEKQVARMLKASCVASDCGYTVRTTALWLRVGLPLCPVHKEPMHPEMPIPAAEDGDPAGSHPESPERAVSAEAC